MNRYDTTATPEEMDSARERLARHTAGYPDEHLARVQFVLHWLGGHVEETGRAADPHEARLVAQARAMYAAYRETSR